MNESHSEFEQAAQLAARRASGTLTHDDRIAMIRTEAYCEGHPDSWIKEQVKKLDEAEA